MSINKSITVKVLMVVFMELVLSFILIKENLFLICKINLDTTLISMIIGLGILFINYEINRLFKIKIIYKINNLEKFKSKCNMFCWLLYLFTSCCIEEIIFRFYLIKWLLIILNPFIACIVSSFLFSLIHFNRFQIIQLSFMGFVLSLLYLNTNSIIYPIIAHFVNNASIYILLKYKKQQLKNHEEMYYN
jgi:membrane protease YdiL (CAAX protease family)